MYAHVFAAVATCSSQPDELDEPLPGPSSAASPEKIKLRREVARLRTKVSRLKKKKTPSTKVGRKEARINNIVMQLKEYLPSETVSFIETQIRMSQRSKHGKRWTIKDKTLALSIFYHSRKAYRLLSKIFCLPSKSTLLRSLRKSNLSPGFNDKIFSALELKVSSMSENSRQCALTFDEISLKSALQYNPQRDVIEGFEHYGDSGQSKYMATHALAFMVRGLATKWKQPVGYFLSAGPVTGKTLQSLTRTCIDKLTKIGLSVKVLICDQGSNNRQFLESFEKVTCDRPFITVNHNPVFVIYDPPHLLKNIRNNLMKQGFIVNDKRVQWRYVTEFYYLDKANAIRMAPKLQDKHINLPPFASMRVNLAAQILSHSVAAGISTLCILGHLDAEAKHTASFIESFDQLFNVFNSNSLKCSQKFRHAIQNGSGHVQFLKDAMKFIESVKLTSGRALPCLNGWKISIQSLLSLWADLSMNHDFKFLLTNRLNQDCLENMFSVIRSRRGHGDNPNPQEFLAAFRQIVVDKLLLPSESSNCQADIDKVLLDLSSFPATSSQVSDPPVLVESFSDTEIDSDTTNICVQNVVSYMAGYLLRRTPFSCHTCQSKFVVTHLSENDPTTELLKAKAYRETGTLIYPSHLFASLVAQFETVFVKYFSHIVHMEKVLLRLVCYAEPYCEGTETCGDIACKQKLVSAARLYMKVRIFHAIKTSNANNACAHGKRNRKILKLMNL